MDAAAWPRLARGQVEAFPSPFVIGPGQAKQPGGVRAVVTVCCIDALDRAWLRTSRSSTSEACTSFGSSAWPSNPPARTAS
jgi:hypothetical protein